LTQYNIIPLAAYWATQMVGAVSVTTTLPASDKQKNSKNVWNDISVLFVSE